MTARVQIKRAPRGGYVGCVEVETGAFPGKLMSVAKGITKAQALRRAASLAERVAQDPVMRAIMPEAALSAIQTAKTLAAAAQEGPRTLAAYLDGVHTPEAARLASVLAKETARKATREVMPEEDDEEYEATDEGEVGAWWNPISHTKFAFKMAKKLSPTHQLAKRVIAMRKRARRGGDNTSEEYDDGEDEPAAEDVGFLPLMVLAAKYGPQAASMAKKLYLKRQAEKAKRKAARAAAEARASEAEAPAPEAEASETSTEAEG